MSVTRACLVITVPLPPDAPNGRRHWRVVLRDKKAYWERLNMLKAVRLIPPPPDGWPPKVVRISATGWVWNLLDDDNLMARAKIVLDWMRGWGYIVDDRRKNLRWAGIPEQYIDRRAESRVVFTLDAFPGSR